jgi:hypothetical protein
VFTSTSSSPNSSSRYQRGLSFDLNEACKAAEAVALSKGTRLAKIKRLVMRP